MGKHENAISIEEFSDRVEMYVYQDKISNILKIYDDGRLYLDGNYIGSDNLSETLTSGLIKNSSVLYISNILKSASAAHDIWSNSPGYSSASSYKYRWRNEQANSLDFKKAVNLITASAFVLTLAKLISPLASNVIRVGVSVFNIVYNMLKAQKPTTRYASYKASICTVKNGTPYVSSTVGSVYQYRFTFYDRKNCTGYSVNATLYRQMIVT